MENVWSDDVAFEAHALEYSGSNLSWEHCALTEVLRRFLNPYEGFHHIASTGS